MTYHLREGVIDVLVELLTSLQTDASEQERIELINVCVACIVDCADSSEHRQEMYEVALASLKEQWQEVEDSGDRNTGADQGQ
jgi:hypothetical protein